MNSHVCAREANLFNGINLISRCGVKSTFFRIKRKSFPGSSLDDSLALDELERGFPLHRLRRLVPQPSLAPGQTPRRSSLPLLPFFSCLSPRESSPGNLGTLHRRRPGSHVALRSGHLPFLNRSPLTFS